MKDFKIYIITIIVSVLLLLPALICENPVLNTFSSIGCSGIAAAIMAIFLEKTNTKRECEKLKKAKKLFFNQLYDQLIMTIERILWFNDRLPETTFNWDLPDHIYSSLKYMVGMGSQHQEKSLSYDTAIDKLKCIGKNFNLENIKKLNEQDRHKINRLFQIIAASSSYLIIETNTINNNKLILDTEKYLSIEDNKSIIFEISFFIALMEKENKNYQAAIESLINVTEKVRDIGSYEKKDIRVGLHGSFSMKEL